MGFGGLKLGGGFIVGDEVEETPRFCDVSLISAEILKETRFGGFLGAKDGRITGVGLKLVVSVV